MLTTIKFDCKRQQRGRHETKLSKYAKSRVAERRRFLAADGLALGMVGAFGNSSLFLLQALFPVLDAPVPTEGVFPALFHLYLMGSIVTTTYGFGAAALTVLWTTFRAAPSNSLFDA